MTRWSGLAPAVDAHLARWSAVKSETDRIVAYNESRNPAPLTLPEHKYPLISAWTVFAQTWGTPNSDGTIRQEVTTVDGATINGREQFTAGEVTGRVASTLILGEREMLDHAETTYVSAPIVARVTEAALEMEPEPLYETDLFTEAGLLVLEQPIMSPDLHPETGAVTDYLRVAIRAIGWAPSQISRLGEGPDGAGPGIMLFTYTTNDDWKASYLTDLIRAVREGRVELSDTGAETISQLRESSVPRWNGGGGRDALWPCDVAPWRFDTQWRPVGNVAGRNPGEIDSSVAYMRRWFLCLQRFCWQRILIADRERLSKKAGRRLEPLTKQRPRSFYSVLRLRREDGRRPHETGMGQPLAFRTPVRRHWRRVHVASLGPARLPNGEMDPATHRLMRIEPYWRGPEDAPIGPLHKATTVVR